MYKKFFFICVFVAITLTSTQFAAADYRITNSSATETAYVIYSVWRPAAGEWPAGWRTEGYYDVEPRATRNLPVPQGNRWVYIYVKRGGSEIKPEDHATRDSAPFYIHPRQAFIVVETTAGDFLKSDRSRWSLEIANLYEYQNGGSHTIPDEPRLPDLPAQQIYNQAVHSVVWIHAGDGVGSGVLIDKQRQLAVTNQHVTDGAENVNVVFPYRQNRQIMQHRNFYLQSNFEHLHDDGYITEGRVIAENVRTDLAIVQLDRVPTTAREIQHDFSRNVEESMQRGDTIHILGNPGNQLWNWTQGTFQRPYQVCDFDDGTSLIGCLEMEAETHAGNSGGPVLNGQGTLIGILTGGTNTGLAVVAPARNVKTLLNTALANLAALPPQQTYPKRVFRIRNNTGGIIHYEIQWTNSDSWQQQSLTTGFIRTHSSTGQNIPEGYPKIQFDHIVGDGQVTYRRHNLNTAPFQEDNNNHAPTYFFRYNPAGDRLYLFRDALAAPSLSKAVLEETVLLTNYPNPFNPETWIPYALAKPAEVTVTIYAADRKLVRTLKLGHQPAGMYQSKNRAAYWDGKNAVGEPVASGLYFYTLKAGDFTATRKMLIRK